MLFFIRGSRLPIGRCRWNLNTSHVILYRINNWKSDKFHSYLNTSHVILYPVYGREVRQSIQFKYISCYSLSNFHLSSFLPAANLNTSHVILYQEDLRKREKVNNNLNTSHVILYRVFSRTE